MTDTPYKKHRPQRNHALADKFAEAGLVVSKAAKEGELYPSPDQWKGDGVDHINIDFMGETDLGKVLEFGSRPGFNHHIFMNFSTIQGFWWYLRSIERPDDMRTLVGWELRKLSMKSKGSRPIKHLRAIIMDAAYQRVTSNPRIAALMYKNELPFDSYQIAKTGVRIRPSHHSWMVEGYTEIARALQTGTQPDFGFLTDGPTHDIYESVRPVIPESVLARQRAKEERIKQEKEQKQAKAAQPEPKPPVRKEPVVKPVPQVSAAVKPEAPKRKPNEFNFRPGTACFLIPYVSEETKGFLFTDAFKRMVKVNGIMFETAPLAAGELVPLKTVSNYGPLLVTDVVSQEDVLRPVPLNLDTFVTGYVSHDLVRLEDLIFRDGDECIRVPMWTRLNKRTFKHPASVEFPSLSGDEQTTTVEENGSIVLGRSVYLYRKLSDITGYPNTVPSLIEDLKCYKPDESDEEYRYAILHLTFAINLNFANQTSYLAGTVRLAGLSTGSHDDVKRKTTEVELDGGAPLEFPIAGYTIPMCRGRERPRKEAPVVVEETNIAVEAPVEPSVESNAVSPTDPEPTANPAVPAVAPLEIDDAEAPAVGAELPETAVTE